MSIQKFKPCDALNSYINYYWLYKTGEQDLYNQLLPGGYVEIGIKLNDNTINTIIDGQVFPAGEIKVLGQLTRPGGADKMAGAELLIVRFHAYSAFLFFNIKMVDFTNQFFDLKNIYGAETDSLYNRIREQHSIKAKIDVLETFLILKLVKNQKKITRLKPIEYIAKSFAHNTLVSIKDVSNATGLSLRKMQKMFAEYVGVSPKTLFEIIRFQKSLILVQSTDLPLTLIAYECGYFDQAHFIREFKSFTGTVPSSHRVAILDLEVISL